MHPAPLLFGSREHFAQRSPEPERAVTDGQRWAGQAPLLEAAEQVEPGLGVLSVAVGESDQFLGAVGANPDDHQTTQPVLFEADVEVDAIGPPVHVVPIRQITFGPVCVLGLPCLGQPADRRRRKSGVRAQEPGQRRGEVPCRQPAQIEHREDFGDLRRTAHVGGQDPRREPLTVAFIVHSWRFDRHRPGPGDDVALACVPVTNNNTYAGRVDLIGVGVEIGLPLRQQGSGEHLLSGHPTQLIEVDRAGHLEHVDHVTVGLD
jgi:hypothetical protein